MSLKALSDNCLYTTKSRSSTKLDKFVLFSVNKRFYYTNSYLMNQINSKKISFDSDIVNLRLNQYVTEQDQLLFFKNEQHIYDFIITTFLKSYLYMVSNFHEINKDHVNVQKKNNLYSFYDSKNSNLLYFILFTFHTKKK
jgi:hypothetical protein